VLSRCLGKGVAPLRDVEPGEQLTFRIQRSTQEERIIFLVSGEVTAKSAAQVRSLIEAESDCSIALDLREVTLVAREAVQFLARAQESGVTLVNCPEYVTTWLSAERGNL
jgi:hypothetical protein